MEVSVTVHICTCAFVADVKLTTLFTELRELFLTKPKQPPYNNNNSRRSHLWGCQDCGLYWEFLLPMCSVTQFLSPVHYVIQFRCVESLVHKLSVYLGSCPFSVLWVLERHSVFPTFPVEN